jgi:hypothetical protein
MNSVKSPQKVYNFSEQLDVRRQEAKKYEKLAGENLLKMQRANDSLFSSIRLIHSPKQLDQVDSTILHAQTGTPKLKFYKDTDF